MLKGIKKTKNVVEENQPSTIRSNVNVSEIKNQQMNEEGCQDRPDGDLLLDQKQQELTKRYIECYNLFLEGKSELLSEKLQILKNEVHQKKTVQKKVELPQGRGKFDYNMKFDEQDEKDKEKLKKRNRPIMASNRIKQYCIYCPDNEELDLISASNYVYLALAKRKTFKNYYHLILAPVDHQQTMIGLNEDILTEISNYKKCLLQAFDKVNACVVFFEQYFQQNSHIFIQCLAVSYNKAQDMPFFFKQALEDVEGNWSTHKNIIRIEKEKGGLQKQIPRPIKYFYIDFSVGYGYAHVIENERFWKRDFCYEVLATALGIDSHFVKTTEEYSQAETTEKKQKFNKIWAPFDWTQLI